MSSRTLFAAVFGGLLLTLASIDRRSPAPNPPPGPVNEGYVVAIRTRDAYRAGVGPEARKFADRIEAGEFATEDAEAREWATIHKRVMVGATQGTTEAFAAMYAATRALKTTDAEKATSRAAFYRDFGRGMEGK